MNNVDRTQLRTYVFHVRYEDKRPGSWSSWYGADVYIRAYDREEAEKQFRERRWEVSLIPQTGTMRPMGSACTFTCEPAADLSVKPTVPAGYC